MMQQCAVMQAVSDVRDALFSAAEPHNLADNAPGWTALQQAFTKAAAAADSLTFGTAHGATQASSSAVDIEAMAGEWSGALEAATQAVLLWAQGFAGAMHASSGELCLLGVFE